MKANISALVFCLLIFPCVVNATPSNVSLSSGTVAKGNSVTLSGTGFTTHADYNSSDYTYEGNAYLQAAFKDFEDASLTSQGFSAGGANPNVVSIQSGGPSNSTYYERAQYIDGRLAGYGIDQSGNTDSIYASFWFNQDYNGGKPFRWYFGPNTSQDNLYLGKVYNTATLNLAGDLDGVVFGSTFSNNVWHKVEVWADESLDIYRVYIDGEYYADNDGVFSANTHTMSPNGHSVEFPDMVDETTTNPWGYDDIHVNYTPARVELCPGSTWSTRGACHTQPINSWSTTSITFTANQGSFDTDDTAYLYVVDSSNSANASGLEVTIGSGAAQSGSVMQASGAGSVLQASGAGSVLQN